MSSLKDFSVDTSFNIIAVCLVGIGAESRLGRGSLELEGPARGGLVPLGRDERGEELAMGVDVFLASDVLPVCQEQDGL